MREMWEKDGGRGSMEETEEEWERGRSMREEAWWIMKGDRKMNGYIYDGGMDHDIEEGGGRAWVEQNEVW